MTVVYKKLAMPNGIVFSPDGSRLYVADTGGHKRHPDPGFHKLPAGVHCFAVSKRAGWVKNSFKQMKAVTAWRWT